MEDKANGQEPVVVIGANSNPTTPVQDPALEPSDVADVKDADEHSEASRLGRKVKRLEEQLNAVLGSIEEREIERREIDRNLESFTGSVGKGQKPEEVLPEFISTREDVEKVVEARDKRNSQMAEAYRQRYIKTLRQLGGVNNEIHGDILREMQDNPIFNSMETRNPFIDARLNYAEAKASILAKRGAGTAAGTAMGGNPLQNNMATGLSATNRNITSNTPEKINLSPDAEEYRRATGMSDDDVRRFLAKKPGIFGR